MDLYINSAGIVSCAGYNGDENFLSAPPQYSANKLEAIEPDYTGHIPPIQLRRMSKAVRMGIGASKLAMSKAGIEKPDAISVGTTMGCLHDTEVFLSKMIAQQEQMLTPTAFIQSTHNTVSGQIALLSGCYGHNLTYVHRGHSFEHAMLNAKLYLNEHPEERILTGGIDELTDTSLAILQKSNVYREASATPETLLGSSLEGSIAGEGASFFVVTTKPLSEKFLRVKDITLTITKDSQTAIAKLNEFLQRNEISPENIDLVIKGVSGDSRRESFYKTLQAELFSNTSQVAFKHLSGEYGTASSFALGLLSEANDKGNIPSFTVLNHAPKQMKRVLLINHYMHYYSYWYIEMQ